MTVVDIALCATVLKVKRSLLNEWTCVLNQQTCVPNKWTCVLNKWTCVLNPNYQAMVGETVTVAIALFEPLPLLDITSQLPQIVDL
ncbi:hypothetical protein [Nostoc sp. GT001]|uniref:hypothetical protein n=1 Tax=Nostoc sp. GT001 TaxID=3056647 RepID=UPI0025AB20A2|nr:hypothetical protein [Nostoc sp. GT001]MDM9581565.1 hypothetical protein [Nostoc sp. GT001]